MYDLSCANINILGDKQIISSDAVKLRCATPRTNSLPRLSLATAHPQTLQNP